MADIECGQIATAIYVWPTMKVLPVCEKHAQQMRGVAEAMGFNLGQLPLDGVQTCTQQVSQ